jgi:hypothetical protein
MIGLILESHQSKCHDSFWVPKNMVGPSGLTWQLISMWKWVTPGGSAWLCWKSHQVHWRDWKGLDLKIIFAGFICRILLIIGPKRRKNRNRVRQRRRQWGSMWPWRSRSGGSSRTAKSLRLWPTPHTPEHELRPQCRCLRRMRGTKTRANLQGPKWDS